MRPTTPIYVSLPPVRYSSLVPTSLHVIYPILYTPSQLEGSRPGYDDVKSPDASQKLSCGLNQLLVSIACDEIELVEDGNVQQ